MSESVQDLINRMVEEGEYPPPELLEAILERGQEAIEPLLEVLKNGPHEDAIGFAAELLITLKATEALPALLELFRKGEEWALEILGETLGDFGSIVVEPMLEIVNDSTLSTWTRESAVETARHAAGDDLVPRSRVVSELNDLLANLLTRTDAESKLLISTVVYTLADLADPRSRPLIATAFETNKVDKWLVDEAYVEESYQKGGVWDASPNDPRAWLTGYREYYVYSRAKPAYFDEEDELLSLYASRLETPDDETFEDRPLPVETIRKTVQRPGRNDPCWCGSGKKYKKCHWGDDQNIAGSG